MFKHSTSILQYFFYITILETDIKCRMIPQNSCTEPLTQEASSLRQ